MGAGWVGLPRALQDEFWKVHARGVLIKDAAEEVGVDLIIGKAGKSAIGTLV